MADEKEVGTALATELVKQLVESNKSAELTRDVLLEVRDLLAEKVENEKKLLEATDELCGRLEILSCAAHLLTDISSNGKRLTVGDFAHALVEAEEQIFGEGDDGDDDDDGAADREVTDSA